MAYELEVRDPFQRPQLHRRWESVYRAGGIRQHFDDRTMDRLVALLRLKPGDRVLDAGCGTGEHTLRMARRGLHCLGVDISQYAVESATRKARELEGVAAKVEFRQLRLEELDPADGPFDAIHCRGVLMHIPDYHPALDAVCAVLKPGGRIAIFENNRRSLETLCVRIIRRFHKGVSEMHFTPDGIEFRCPSQPEAPIWRIADVGALKQDLADRDVHVVARCAHELVDLNRFPTGFMRDGAALLNMAWFSLRLPAVLSHGNLLVGEKRAV